MKKQGIPKKIASLGLAFALVSSTGINIWAQDILPSAIEVKQTQEIEKPEITTHNIRLTAGKLDYLIENTGYTKDVDFEADLASQDAYFEFAYSEDIAFSGLQVVGWWPKEQGIKTLSLEYYDGREWQACGTDIFLDWQTPVGSGGPEHLLVELETPVVGSKFRVRVVDTYRTWGNKSCMRLMKPIGTLPEGSIDKSPLDRAIQSTESIIKDALVGSEGGRFPLEAMQSVEAVIEEVREARNTIETQEQLDEQINKLKQAVQSFKASQNPLLPHPYRPSISLNGLAVKEGKIEDLLDTQLITTLALEQTSEEAYLTIDYRDQIFALDELGIIATQPEQIGFDTMDIECFKEGEWVPITQNHDVTWNEKGYYAREKVIYQGSSVKFDTPIEASQFRIKLHGATTPDINTLLSELKIRGSIVVDKTSLQTFIQQGETLLQDDTIAIEQQLKDLLKIYLVEAQLAYDTPKTTKIQIEKVQSQLQAIIGLITGEEEFTWIEATLEAPEVIPSGESVPLTIRLEPNGKNILAADFTLTYDQATLQVGTIQENENIEVVGTKEEEGKIRILLAATQPLTQSTQLLGIQLEASKLPQSQTTTIQLTEGSVGIVVDGEASIAPIKGAEKNILIEGEKTTPNEDINQDGKTDISDLALVAYYYLADTQSPNWQQAQKADVTGDGKVDIEDLSQVAKRILDK